MENAGMKNTGSMENAGGGGRGYTRLFFNETYKGDIKYVS